MYRYNGDLNNIKILYQLLYIMYNNITSPDPIETCCLDESNSLIIDIPDHTDSGSYRSTIPDTITKSVSDGVNQILCEFDILENTTNELCIVGTSDSNDSNQSNQLNQSNQSNQSNQLSKIKEEPLLAESTDRFVMFPIVDDAVWKMYKKQVDCFWRAEEVDLSKDVSHWNELTVSERGFIKSIIAFFASSDGIVLENLAIRFMGDVQLSEARAFYGFQIAMENIHSEMYSLLIDTLIDTTDEKNMLFKSIDTYPCIRRKADWARNWIDDKKSTFATRLIAFACIEGIFFSGAFCSIYWLKRRGVMPGLTFSNELISRDEALHTEFAVLLYSRLKNRLDESTIHDIIKDAVNIEQEFICEALPCRLIGMNSSMMSRYIEFVADRLVVQLGYNKIYETANPFDFMEMISIEGKTNFFEKRTGEYALADKSKSDDIFDIGGDF